MDENQKPVQPLNPHLANLIGEFAVSQQNSDRFQRVWLTLTGSPMRRLASASVLMLVALLCLANLLAFRTSINFTTVQAAHLSVDTGKSDAQLRQQIKTRAEAYGFAVTYPDKTTKNFKLADSGIVVNDQASVAQIRQTVRHLGWQRFAWWHKTNIPLVIHKQNKQFEGFIATNVAVANTPAKDATVTVQAGKALITDGANGSTYQIAGGNKQLVSAASALTPFKANLEPTQVKPAIQRANLTAAATKINDYTSHSVTFAIGARSVVVTPAEIGNWLDIEPVPAQKTVDVTVNSGKIQAYVDRMTASSIYPAKAQISTTDASGATTVLVAGRNGSAVANKAVVVKSISNQLQQQGSVITANFEITEDAFKTINAGDYEKWLVADVSTKRMYAYEHNRLVRTFLISAGAPKTPTVLGTYQIYRKVPLRTMRGANADGSRYEQPDVKYVNYFYKDYAVHGNYWRPASYFGNVNSSHGCVGITDSDAEWIYNWAPIGTTVITHN